MDNNVAQNQSPLSEEAQKLLNTPLVMTQPMTDQDQQFLNMLVDLVNSGKINLYGPDTLINHAIYDTLPQDRQGKVDLEAINLLGAIREIKDLQDHGFGQTFQINNLVERLRVTKERLESEGGDLFII